MELENKSYILWCHYVKLIVHQSIITPMITGINIIQLCEINSAVFVNEENFHTEHQMNNKIIKTNIF